MPRDRAKPPTGSALRAGNPFADERDLDKQWRERGIITSVNPSTLTCNVDTETSGRLAGLALPEVIQDPQGSGGQVAIPRPGQSVVVQRGLGFPFIDKLLPLPTSKNASRANAFSIVPTAGGKTATTAFPPGDTSNYLGNLPSDLLPGDWARLGNQGQYVGIFDGGAGGGIAGLYASPWAHVIAFQENDTLSLAGRNLKLKTGMGNLESSDFGGKQALLLQLGTDQKVETGQGTERFPLTVKMGGDSEGLLDFVLTDRQGEPVYKRLIFSDGEVTENMRGLQTTYRGQVTRHYNQGLLDFIVGNVQRGVSGDQIDIIQGSHEYTVSQNLVSQVLNDQSENVNRNWLVSVGQTMDLTVSGNVLAKPGDASAHWMFSNGSLVVDIGMPPTDLNTALSGLKLTTYAAQGNVELSALLSKIILNTTIPDSVLLGSVAGVATFHAVLWEPLQIFLKALINWATNHIHPTGVGPSGVAVIPSPASAILDPLVTPIGSLKVMLGG